MLSKEMAEKFRELYRIRFGEEISIEEAFQKGMALLHLVQSIYLPIPNEPKEKN